MGWALRLGQVAGIGIFIHWTFFLLLLWVGYSHAAAGEGPAMIVSGVGFILALFGCVVLHELGHALTARHYGIPTRDITLLPIGGVARLERMPEAPLQEFWVAVAGPAVNVVIALVLFGILRLTGHSMAPDTLTVVSGSFLSRLMFVNIGLVIFNMLPAFPMDGGRVLRAILAMRMPRVQATNVAAKVGQAMAILFGIAGVMSGNFMLLFIAMFVYTGAQGEAQGVEIRSILSSYRVRDAMISRFHTLTEQDTVEVTARESAAGNQKDFPVLRGQAIAGIVLYADLVKSLRMGDGDQAVSQIMRNDCLLVDANDRLDHAMDRMNACGCTTLLVQSNEQLVGIITEEHLGRWLMLHTSVRPRNGIH